VRPWQKLVGESRNAEDCFFSENGRISWMKSDFLLMSVLLAWQRGADQKIDA